MWDADLKNEKHDENQKKARTLKKFLIWTLILLLVAYVGFPCAFRYSSKVKSNLAFLNLLQNPFKTKMYQLAIDYGFEGARNFYLTSSEGDKLGVWHLLPTKLQAEAASLDIDDPYNVTVAARYHSWLQDANVFVYCHGTSGTRAANGRVKLYKVLNSMGYHVITFDYRGYGDSTGHPTTEEDVTSDARTVLDWLRGHVNGGHIFLWGHSLGSGVVSNLLSKLELEPENPVAGAVLESSFSSLLDAIRAYPPSLPYARLPGFDSFAVKPIANHGLAFRSEEYLSNVTVPLLFLHSEDDSVVPYRLGRKLYESVLSSRKDLSTVTFVTYSKDLHYGHTKICEDPNLGGLVNEFVKSSVERKTPLFMK